MSDPLRDLKRGMRAWNRRSFAQAVEYLTVGLKGNAKAGVFWAMLGDSLRELGRLDQSLRALRKARRYSPEGFRHQTSRLLGKTYVALRRFRSAERWYRQATKDAPHKIQRWVDLGVFYFDAGRLKLAESILRRAIRITDDPDLLSEALLNLGYVLRSQGHYCEARDSFQEALRLDPRYHLAKQALRDVAPLAER